MSGIAPSSLAGRLLTFTQGRSGMLMASVVYSLSNALLVSLLARSLSLSDFGRVSAALILHVFLKESARNYWATSALASGDFSHPMPKTLARFGTACTLLALLSAATGFTPAIPSIQIALVTASLPIAAVDFARDRAIACSRLELLHVCDLVWALTVIVPWVTSVSGLLMVSPITALALWLTGALVARVILDRAGATAALPRARWHTTAKTRISMMLEFSIANGTGLLVAFSLPVLANYDALGAYRGVGVLFGISPVVKSWVAIVVLRDGWRAAVPPQLVSAGLIAGTAVVFAAFPGLARILLGDGGPAAAGLAPYKALEALVGVSAGATLAEARRAGRVRWSLVVRTICAIIGGATAVTLLALGGGPAGLLVGISIGGILVIGVRLTTAVVRAGAI